MRRPKLLPTAALAITGTVSLGLLSLSSVAASAEDGLKRDEDSVELVLATDDDDDDDSNSGASNTGSSRSGPDATNSRVTEVSRDRDLSRGDKTRDWTTDGPGDRTRDWSANKTNDRSRNDTRR